jgi:hypothetical protein
MSFNSISVKPGISNSAGPPAGPPAEPSRETPDGPNQVLFSSLEYPVRAAYLKLYEAIVYRMVELGIITLEIATQMMNHEHFNASFDFIVFNTKRKKNLSYFASGLFEYFVNTFELSAPGEAGFETPPQKYTGSLTEQKEQHQADFYKIYAFCGFTLVARNEAYSINSSPIKGDPQNRLEFAFLTQNNPDYRSTGFDRVKHFHMINWNPITNTMVVNFHNSSGSDGPTAIDACLQFVHESMLAFSAYCEKHDIVAPPEIVFVGDANVSFSPENTADLQTLAREMNALGFKTIVNSKIVRSTRLFNIFANQQAMLKPGGQETVHETMVAFVLKCSDFQPGDGCFVVPLSGDIKFVGIVDAFSATQHGATAGPHHILADHMIVSVKNTTTEQHIAGSNEASIMGSRGKTIRGPNLCPGKPDEEIIPILNQYTEDIKPFFCEFITKMISLGLFTEDAIAKAGTNPLKLLKAPIVFE